MTWIVTNHIAVELFILKAHIKNAFKIFIIPKNISLCLRPNIRLIRQLSGFNFDFNALNGQIYL